jgi:hypothetical protein
MPIIMGLGPFRAVPAPFQGDLGGNCCGFDQKEHYTLLLRLMHMHAAVNGPVRSIGAESCIEWTSGGRGHVLGSRH